MIFLPDSVALILSGAKTQTRRPTKEGDSIYRGRIGRGGRLLWEVGRTYAVCPGRGKRAVCRIRITEIRCRRVCDISDKDVPAEGLRWDFKRGRWVYGKTVLENRAWYPNQNIAAYLWLWRSMYPKSDCEELCWALTFELVK